MVPENMLYEEVRDAMRNQRIPAVCDTSNLMLHAFRRPCFLSRAFWGREFSSGHRGARCLVLGTPINSN